jgi:5-hydroxyisourate hydrolase
MSAITTHVLDTARGCPAVGIAVSLEQRAADGTWRALGTGVTNPDGRIANLLPDQHKLECGIYRLTFHTAAYHQSHSADSFFPAVTITFEIKNPGGHYHVPLLLSPYGYSTYRGS